LRPGVYFEKAEVTPVFIRFNTLLWSLLVVIASVEILDLVCYCKDSIVRGHHIYKTIWTSFIGKILLVNREEDNPYDDHAVAVYLDDYIVGHLPRSISEISWFFIMHGGRISCEITGH